MTLFHRTWAVNAKTPAEHLTIGSVGPSATDYAGRSRKKTVPVHRPGG